MTPVTEGSMIAAKSACWGSMFAVFHIRDK